MILTRVIFILALSLTAARAMLCSEQIAKKGNMRTLKVGYPAEWGSLVPALQHTAYADQILANEFETLVREGAGGALLPSLAKSWRVNDNYTEYTFKLDTSRKFSNGTGLSAAIVKAAWEYGLELPAISANSSLQDVLYLVEGYDRFVTTKTLSGLVVESDDTLRVRFSKPFRTALEEFGTSRLAVFIPDAARPYGTGPYIIDSHEKNGQVTMRRNPFYEGTISFPEVTVSYVPPDRMKEALASGEVDVYAFADRAPFDCSAETGLACFAGMESGHQAVFPNGLEGRTFADKHLRLAIQYILTSAVKDPKRLPPNLRSNFKVDPQSYLDFQQGRLEPIVAENLVAQGAKYVPALQAASKKSPIYVVSSDLTLWVQEILEEAGLTLDPRSGRVTFRERLRLYYKDPLPDLVVGTVSIASGDPDGLYHALGRDGAITSPIAIRPRVCDALEIGRSLIDVTALDEHYKTVSRLVLEEVPYVHIGFMKGSFAYNPSRLKVSESQLTREGNGLVMFETR